MPRKTKQISKEPKAIKNDEVDQDEGQIFSQSFKERLDQYASLSKEVLATKAQLEGTNPNKQIKARRERVSEKVQAASTTILKEELGSLEEWIIEQQKNLVEQINLIKGAHSDNRKNLESTNAFTKEEIESQLQPLQKRAEERQAIHDNYGVLLERSKNIYKQ